MPRNKNSFRMVSAFARGLWLMDADAAHASYVDFKAIVNGTKVFALDEDLPEDDLIDPDDDILNPSDDLDADDYPELSTDGFTGKIAVMSITGPIMHYGGPCSYGAVEYAARLRQYADDPTISAGILLGDTPGGQVQGTQTWADAVAYFKSKKPIIGLINDGMVASAGVWGFANCTEIYASHSTCQMGSVGVMSRVMDFRKALEKEGISEIVTYAPQSKDKCKDYDDLLDGDDTLRKADLKFLADQFIAAVTNGRGDKLASDDWKTGKMFFAADAKKLGLLDGIMPYQKVVQRAMYLATKQNPDNNQSNTMFGKNKFSALTALVGVAAAGVTAAHVEAINNQIDAENIDGVTAVLDSELEATEAIVLAAGSALTSINNLLGADAKHDNLAAAVTALQTAFSAIETDRNNWMAKAKEYGAQPAAEPTSTQKSGTDPIDDTKAENPFYSEADAGLKDLRKQAGFKGKEAKA